MGNAPNFLESISRFNKFTSEIRTFIEPPSSWLKSQHPQISVGNSHYFNGKIRNFLFAFFCCIWVKPHDNKTWFTSWLFRPSQQIIKLPKEPGFDDVFDRDLADVIPKHQENDRDLAGDFPISIHERNPYHFPRVFHPPTASRHQAQGRTQV